MATPKLVEQRVYTLQPGKAAEWIKAYEPEALQPQVATLGHMVGYFHTEFGALNQVVHMWGYSSVEDRMKRRAELFTKDGFNSFLGKLRPFLITMESKLFIPAPFSPVGGVRPVKNTVDGSKHPIVEERIYTLLPGTPAQYLKAYEEEGIKVQVPILGSMVGYYTTEFGPLNQIIHMWSYASLDERTRRRAEMAQSPAWNAYVAKVRPFLLKQENRLLTPAPFSPIGGVRPVKNPM